MAPFLQVVIAVVLLVLCGFLVPLLIQLKRTATSVQRLADSAKSDLNAVAEDLHQVRRRVDQLADMGVATLQVPATLGEWVATLGRTLPDLLGGKTPGWIGLVLGALKLALGAFSRHKSKGPEA